MILVHPQWVARAGIGDIVRHFDTRGFNVGNTVGSRFFAVSEKPAVVPEGTPVRASGFELIRFWRR